MSSQSVTLESAGAKRSSREWVWLSLIALLFLLQAVPLLSYRWVTDESWYAGPAVTMASAQGLHDPGIGPNDLEHIFDSRPPGTALSAALFFKLFGTTTSAARMVSICAGLVMLVTIFSLAREMFGVLPALIATALFATDNIVVLVSRTLRPEALTTMAIVLALFCMHRYGSTHRLRWAAASGFLIAMGAMFHVTVLGWVAALGLLAIAIGRRSGGFLLGGALAYAGAFFAGLLPYATWILSRPNRLGIISFHEEFLSRATADSPLQKVLHEGRRYSDWFGINVLHGKLAALPTRLPIVLLVVFAMLVLWRYRPRWIVLELILLVPSLVWMIYVVNKSSRYFAIVVPIFALSAAAAVAALQDKPRQQRILLGFAGFIVLFQFAGNLYMLRQARKADYNKVSAELESVIPRDAAVYGSIEFWFGLRDHPYVSYERTFPRMAATQFGARYFILGDRMMTGAFGEEDYYARIRNEAADTLQGGQLVGEFDDPYYGDLKVFRANLP